MVAEKMLLYTRIATPRAPKRRSRTGCNFCKDKKKKCDEVRPSCTRCRDHGEDCRYDPIRPRQRRKSEASQGCLSSIDAPSASLKPKNELELPCSSEATALSSAWPSFDAHSINPAAQWGTQKMVRTNLNGAHHCFEIPSSARKADTTGHSPFGESEKSSETNMKPSLALTRPTATPSPVVDVCFPSFGEFSQNFRERSLMDYFCNTLSHLIVLREDEGNPFQQLVLPLAYKSQAVKGAIYALASAHLVGKSINRLENDQSSIKYHNEAIRNLARLIEKRNGVNRNELLATIMLIVYYEVLLQKRRSNLVEGHLKGAMAIMRRCPPSQKDRTSSFLEEAFRFYDVIAALSSGTAPLSKMPVYEKLQDLSLCCSEQQISLTGGVDALLGLAASLWPVIHRLSSLLSLKNALEALEARGDMLRDLDMQIKFDAECAAVESSLDKWQPVIPTECVIYCDSANMSLSAKRKMQELQSIFNTALAYRHSALVYLYRTIYNRTRNHPVVQHHASASLVHCKATVLHEGPMGALLWPLFVASCEAIEATDREAARDTFQGIAYRQGMANIDMAWQVVQEVWTRADETDAWGTQTPSGLGFGSKDLWRRVSEDMGVTIVFG